MVSNLPEEKKEPAIETVASFDEKVEYHGEDIGDRIIPGSEGVTEREYATLRRVADRLPYTAWLVVVVEFAERCVHSVRVFTPHSLSFAGGLTTEQRTLSTIISVRPSRRAPLRGRFQHGIGLRVLLALSVKASRNLSPSAQ